MFTIFKEIIIQEYRTVVYPSAALFHTFREGKKPAGMTASWTYSDG